MIGVSDHHRKATKKIWVGKSSLLKSLSWLLGHRENALIGGFDLIIIASNFSSNKDKDNDEFNQPRKEET